MPYQYNFNKNCNYIRQNQEKRKVIKKYSGYNYISRSGLTIESCWFCLKIQIAITNADMDIAKKLGLT